MNRRSFIKGILVASVAPAIVSVENIMKIVVPRPILKPNTLTPYYGTSIIALIEKAQREMHEISSIRVSLISARN